MHRTKYVSNGSKQLSPLQAWENSEVTLRIFALLCTNLTITELPQYTANGPDVNWFTVGSPDGR